MATQHRRNFIVYLILTFLSGTSCATFLPVMSVFLKDSVKATPFEIGLYFTLAAIAGIAVTQIFAVFSDGRMKRKTLIVGGGIAGMFAAIVFILSGLWQCYWLIAILGVAFMSFSGLSTPQVFASAREYSLAHNVNNVMFTMYMRAFFALAWVIAPPLAYIIAVRLGYSTLFSFTALFFALIAVIGAFWLPYTVFAGNQKLAASAHENESVDSRNGATTSSEALPEAVNESDLAHAQAKTPAAEKQQSSSKSSSSSEYSIFAGGFKVWKDVALLFVAVTLMWTTNNAYLISMPIFIRDELKISQELPGVMMACAALMEIPIMLLAGKLTARFGIKNLQVFSAIGGVLFYLSFCVMPHDTAWGFLAVQLFNSIFIGILAGIGMVYFQELLPKIPGQATTLFSNTTSTGAIISGLIVAVVTSFGSYGHVFVINMLLSLWAFCLLFFVRKV